MIPLSSDTETRPTEAMRRAIAAAEVGDEQRGEDPTVNRLLERVAVLLGKEAALFLPTGTMCNLVAVKAHTQPGEVLLAEAASHVLRAESGGAALVSGVMTEPVAARPGSALPEGVFDGQDLQVALDRIRAAPSPYAPVPRLVCVENTHNFGGGTVWPLEALRDLRGCAARQGLAVHMDGARLMNAAVASGLPASAFCEHVDSVWLDFTKGLGAPIGAVLAGSAEFVARARRYKHAFGGAMRQAGVAAAACLHALDHHVERLAEDHDNARSFAQGIASLPGIALVHGLPQTNIVFFRVDASRMPAARLAAELAARGVRVSAIGETLRAVTHLDVSRAQVDRAVAAIAAVLG